MRPALFVSPPFHGATSGRLRARLRPGPEFDVGADCLSEALVLSNRRNSQAQPTAWKRDSSFHSE